MPDVLYKVLSIVDVLNILLSILNILSLPPRKRLLAGVKQRDRIVSVKRMPAWGSREQGRCLLT